MMRGRLLLRRFFPAAPSWMVATLVAGAVLTIVGVFGSWRARKDLQREPYNDQTTAYAPKRAGSDPELSCQGVLDSRAGRLLGLDKDIERSEKRSAHLETLLLRPGSPHFLGARAELTRENEFAHDLRERHKSLL